MKKTISILLAAAALAGVGMAQAQDGGAECQASGRCGHQAREQGLDANGNYDPRIAQENAARGIYPQGAYYGGIYGFPQIIANGQLVQPHIFGQYPRTNRDRDGDGVRNSRDRYPDDGRYR